MKKTVAMILIAAIFLTLTGCSAGSRKNKDGNTDIHGNEISSEVSESPDESDLSADAATETSTAQMETTVVDETLTNMIRPLDSILIVEYVTSFGYAPQDPVVYWSTMYYYLCLYGPRASGASYDDTEEYLIVGPEIVRETGRVLYGETVAMPEIPETIARISLHEDGNYYVKNDPRPESYPEFVSAVQNEDGSYEVIAQLTDVRGSILVNHSFHLTPKSSVNNLLGIQFYYTVSNAGVG